MLNNITIMGNITRDPELRRTQSGTSVLAMNIAVERDYKGKDGKKETDFIDCVFWGKTAEYAAKYFTKGRRVVVNGSLQSRKWTDKNNNNRISWEVQGSSIYFADSKQSNGSSKSNVVEAQENNEFAEIEEDGEIPF